MSLFTGVRDLQKGAIDSIEVAFALNGAFSEQYLESDSRIPGMKNKDVLLERYDRVIRQDGRATSALSQLSGVGLHRPSFSKFVALQKEWSIPVLFISGTHDKIIDVANSFQGFFTLLVDAQGELHRESPHVPLPPLRLTLFSGVGHIPQVERHEEFNELLFKDWFQRQVHDYELKILSSSQFQQRSAA